MKRKTSTANISQKQNKKPTNKGNRSFFDKLLIVVISMILMVGVSGFFMLSIIVGKVSASGLADKLVNKEPSIFYAADGTKIGELGGESRENITYSQLPQSTIDAFLSIEDSRYFSHNGFDLPRFLSSALTNLRSASFAQGGSTLTMQTIDNFLMKPEEDKRNKEGKSFSTLEKVERKIQEIYLSMRLETTLDKEEIMTKYLNEINFGYRARGIQKGAQYYFGKNVEELNLSESAFLAGVINAPNSYNPYSGGEYYKLATSRRDKTLSMMLTHGFISETEYKLAKATKLAFQLSSGTDIGTDDYQAYMDKASQEVYEVFGVDPAVTPLNIYTALDTNAQNKANALSGGEGYTMPDNPYYQLGFTVLNNKTGEITAVSAGRNDIEAQYIWRFDEERQPGSALKPIIDYVPVFDKLGWCTSRVLTDEAFKIDGRTIGNADGKFYGDVTIERAIAKSLNTPALQSLQASVNKLGADELIDYLQSLGFTDQVAEGFNLQYGIGASTMQASPTQMAAAYAAMANGGYYIEPHMVTKIEFKDGSKTIENNPKKQRVMSEQAAFMISDLLYKAVNGKYKGENLMGSLGFGSYPVYGKTGTSDYGGEGYKYGGEMKDEWMVNYTSEFTIATWTGFDQPIEGGNTNMNDYLYMNVNGHINKAMLDTITTSNATMIAKPSTGISEYGGGYIKTEFLADAAKNNPKTETGTNAKADDLKSSISTANSFNAEDYTEESFKELMTALQAANLVMNNTSATQEEIDAAKKALDKAINALVKKEKQSIDNSELTSLLSSAPAYLDTSKYQVEYVNKLQRAITNGIQINAKADATQEEIDKAASELKAAQQACIDNPIAVTPPPTPPVTPPVTPEVPETPETPAP